MLYINGIGVAAAVGVRVNGVARSLNYIGRSSSSWPGGGGMFAGRIDEFRIWGHALSETQLRAGMTSTLLGAEPGLVLYFKFDEGQGSIATNWAVTNAGAAGPASTAGTLINEPRYSTAAPIGEPASKAACRLADL